MVEANMMSHEVHGDDPVAPFIPFSEEGLAIYEAHFEPVSGGDDTANDMLPDLDGHQVQFNPEGHSYYEGVLLSTDFDDPNDHQRDVEIQKKHVGEFQRIVTTNADGEAINTEFYLNDENQVVQNEHGKELVVVGNLTDVDTITGIDSDNIFLTTDGNVKREDLDPLSDTSIINAEDHAGMGALEMAYLELGQRGHTEAEIQNMLTSANGLKLTVKNSEGTSEGTIQLHMDEDGLTETRSANFALNIGDTVSFNNN